MAKVRPSPPSAVPCILKTKRVVNEVSGPRAMGEVKKAEPLWLATLGVRRNTGAAMAALPLSFRPVASGNEAKLYDNVAGEMIQVKLCELDRPPPVAVTVTLYVPRVLGVPPINPLAAFKVSPGGKP